MVFEKLGTLGEGRKRKEFEQIAQIVTTFEPEVEDLSDEELAHRTIEFRERSAPARAWTTSCPRPSPPSVRPRAARSASATSTCS